MIKLSKLTDYAVVVLSMMSAHKGEKFSASALSEKTGLPEPTVAKVLKTLARENLISSERGVNGGYVMAQGASEVKILEVITAMDGPLAVAACVDDSKGCCDFEENCSMKGKWNPVNTAIRNALSGITLADMVR